MTAVWQGWTAERWILRASQVALAVFLVFWALWLGRVLGLSGAEDVPNVDFIVYWTAAELGVAGEATTAYDTAAFEAQQVKAVGEKANGFPWVYPPVAFLLVLPLALTSYGVAFVAWLVATGAVLLSALRRLATGPASLWLAVAFPGTLFNLIIGQAGLLTAGLFAWGMLLLPSRPLAAGVLLGSMAFKPHFMPLILVALFAARERSALLATLGSSAAMVATSLLIFGTGPWEQFLSQLTDSTEMLFGDIFPVAKMQSVTALMLSLGVSDVATQAVQAVVTLAAAIFVFWLWRQDVAFEYKAAGLGLASLLATPYVYHYDLTVMGVAMLFVARRAVAKGWRSWEPPLLAVAWLAPLVSFALGLAVEVTIGAPILIALTAMVAVRARDEAREARQTIVVPSAAA